jgi:hypothetical protein
MYDVGLITRRIQSQFRLFCPMGQSPNVCAATPNRATPANVLLLLDELDEVTQAVVDEVKESPISPAARIGFAVSMNAWRSRLGTYRAHAAAAAPNDRRAILWDVTAPLLLGFYGGEDSDEPQRAIDAVTPFLLANMQEVDDSFREELFAAFLQDLRDGATAVIDAVPAIAGGLGIGALAIGGLALLLVLRR